MSVAWLQIQKNDFLQRTGVLCFWKEEWIIPEGLVPAAAPQLPFRGWG